MHQHTAQEQRARRQHTDCGNSCSKCLVRTERRCSSEYRRSDYNSAKVERHRLSLTLARHSQGPHPQGASFPGAVFEGEVGELNPLQNLVRQKTSL